MVKAIACGCYSLSDRILRVVAVADDADPCRPMLLFPILDHNLGFFAFKVFIINFPFLSLEKV